MRDYNLVRLTWAICLGLVLATAGPAGQRATGYRYTVLPDVPGAKSMYAGHTNAHGEIVGYYQDPANRWHGFLHWRDQFEIVDVPGANHTRARGINERGDIVGDYTIGTATRQYGFLLSQGEFTTINYPTANSTRLWDVNNRGEIAGEFQAVSGGAWQGFTLRDEQFTPVEVPNATMSAAWSINERGEIVGHYTLPGTKMLGYRMSRNEEFTYFDYPSSFSEYPDGFTGKAGAYGMSCAQGIGDVGDVVGHYQDNSDGIVYGYVWRKGQFTTMRVPDAHQTYPTSVTPDGVIAGYHMDSTHKWRVFIAEPLNPRGR